MIAEFDIPAIKAAAAAAYPMVITNSKKATASVERCQASGASCDQRGFAPEGVALKAKANA